MATIPLGDFFPGAVDFLAAVERLWVVVAAVARFFDGPALPSSRDIVVDVFNGR